MRRIFGVITDDSYLFQKIKLTLKDIAEVKRAMGKGSEVFDLTITDLDFSDAAADISLSRSKECDLKIPFTYAELKEAVTGRAQRPLELSESDKCAVLRGKKIKLTELEFSLLSYLFNAGRAVGKDELLREVWGGGSGDGIVNVYIHYLREKLEAYGEKIIVCSRKHGYSIDEKFLHGGRDAYTD